MKKNEIQDIIACKQGAIESVLLRVYKKIQNFSGVEELNNGKNNLSSELVKEKENNDRLNINNSNPYSDNVKINYVNSTDSQLKRLLEEKDMKIEELKNIIEVYFYNIDFGNETAKFYRNSKCLGKESEGTK